MVISADGLIQTDLFELVHFPSENYIDVVIGENMGMTYIKMARRKQYITTHISAHWGGTGLNAEGRHQII